MNQSQKVQSDLQLQQMFDRSPRVAAQRKLAATFMSLPDALEPQPQPVQRAATGVSTPVIQRYQESDAGKVSQGNKLLLETSSSLYAADEQFERANQIGGDIFFDKGAAKQVAQNTLHQVEPRVKERSELDATTADYDESQETEKATEQAQKRYYPTVDDLAEQLKNYLLDNYSKEERNEMFLEVDAVEQSQRKELINGLAETAFYFLEIFGNFDESAIAARLKQYFQNQQDVAGRPLMPSDCRAMASYVAGFDAGSEGVETEEIAPGNVYQYQTENKMTEWDFHYAAIIMTDGSDHVTMENAAAKASDKFSKMPYDRSWFFEMYGTKEGQTFEDKYGPLMNPEENVNQ